MHAATDAQGAFFSVLGANGCVVANARARNLESVAFDQDFVASGRPRALLRLQFADTNVAVIFDDEEDEGAPLDGAGLNASAHDAAGLGIAHRAIRQH